MFKTTTVLSKLVLATLAVVSSGPAQSQGSNWAQDCRAGGGQVVDYRVSRIKDGVPKAEFEKAFMLHQRWYRERGYSESRMMLGDPIEADPSTKTMGPVANEVVTLHLNAPAIPAERRDAAWDEYVSAYRKAADLVVDKKLCIRLAP